MENNRIFDADYTKKVRSQFNEYQKQNKYCDLKLKIPDGSIFNVHRIIMICGCEYFRGLFDFYDKGVDESESKLNAMIDFVELDQDIPGNIFQKIIEYIYTGEICLTIETALALHEYAVFLSMTSLKKICSNFLVEKCSIRTSLECWRHSKFDDDLKKKSMDIIEANCEEFLELHLLQLSFNEINEITRKEEIVCTGHQLYEFIVKWVKNDLDQRKDHLVTLLNNVESTSISDHLKLNLILAEEADSPLTLILTNHFRSNNVLLQKEPIFFAVDKDCVRKLNGETFSFKINHESEQGLRITDFNSKYILMSGGYWDRDEGKTCKFYDINSNEIKKFPHMNHRRSYHEVLEMNSKIYACGGFHNPKTIEFIDLNSQVWKKGPEMNRRRYSFAMTKHQNCLYAIGGNGENSIEQLDPREGKWFNVIESEKLKNNFKISAISKNEEIIFFTYPDITIFDPRTKEFIEVRSLANYWWGHHDTCSIDGATYFFSNYKECSKCGTSQRSGVCFGFTEDEMSHQKYMVPTFIKANFENNSFNRSLTLTPNISGPFDVIAL